jgi:molybdenum cofactor cytidylyltransferase
VSTAGVILAAGFSRRLGRAKQTVVLGGETLVERAARVAIASGVSPVIVVVNREADFCEALERRGCLVVMNERAREGMASSIRRGVVAARSFGASGVVLMTCDQVALEAEHLLRLLDDPTRIVGSSYAGRTGIPAYFPASVFEELLMLQGDMGARDLLRSAETVVNESLAVDIDTEEDVDRVGRGLG